ncbi:MAG: TraB/GumN family protein [Bauldia sp.]
MKPILGPAVVATCLLFGATPAAADPALFVARDADTTIYLFGTIHYAACDPVAPGPAGPLTIPDVNCVDWMSDEVEAALDAADELWVETVDIADEALVASLIQELGYLDDGVLLTDFMPEEEVRLMAEMIAGPMADTLLPELNTMQPWLVSMLAGATSMMGGGASPTEGVDLILMELAEERGVPIRGFETADAQIRLFASDPIELQVAALRTTIIMENHGIDVATLTQWMFDRMWGFWLAGDLESLAFLILGEDERFFEQFDAELEELLGVPAAELDAIGAELEGLLEGFLDPTERAGVAYETAIGVRNRDWILAINDMLDRAGTFFVAVGAAHLTGEAAVQTLIEQPGVTVERVQ